MTDYFVKEGYMKSATSISVTLTVWRMWETVNLASDTGCWHSVMSDSGKRKVEKKRQGRQREGGETMSEVRWS